LEFDNAAEAYNLVLMSVKLGLQVLDELLYFLASLCYLFNLRLKPQQLTIIFFLLFRVYKRWVLGEDQLIFRGNKV